MTPKKTPWWRRVAASADLTNETDLKSYWQSFSSIPAIEHFIEQQNWDIDSYINQGSPTDSDSSIKGDHALGESTSEQHIVPIAENPVLPHEWGINKRESTNVRLPFPNRVITYADLALVFCQS